VVLELVSDEHAALRELARVIRARGHLALFSPNRWFPFEGHGARINEKWAVGYPLPLLPWLPGRLTGRFQTARNYWPSELRRLVSSAGFEIAETGWALVRFGHYPWLPKAAIEWFHRNSANIERSPLARLAAVSTYVLARKP
jgi:hypothetical protein